MKVYSVFLVLLFLFSCSEQLEQTPNVEPTVKDSSAIENFSIRNDEIRNDIVTALLKENIEHWVNDDGSIGFYARDADAVDRIGYDAIGAYSARN